MIVGIMGGAHVQPETERLAYELGQAIAAQGWMVLTGGRDAGVMAAASRGAKEAGGTVIGVLPGRDKQGMSPHVDIPIITGLGDARNAVNVLTSDAVVALAGGAGTLSEIALAVKAGTPVVVLGRDAPLGAANVNSVAAAVGWLGNAANVVR